VGLYESPGDDADLARSGALREPGVPLHVLPLPRWIAVCDSSVHVRVARREERKGRARASVASESASSLLSADTADGASSSSAAPTTPGAAPRAHTRGDVDDNARARSSSSSSGSASASSSASASASARARTRDDDSVRASSAAGVHAPLLPSRRASVGACTRAWPRLVDALAHLCGAAALRWRGAHGSDAPEAWTGPDPALAPGAARSIGILDHSSLLTARWRGDAWEWARALMWATEAAAQWRAGTRRGESARRTGSVPGAERRVSAAL
jgi:hypothetical protein